MLYELQHSAVVSDSSVAIRPGALKYSPLEFPPITYVWSRTTRSQKVAAMVRYRAVPVAWYSRSAPSAFGIWVLAW
jgi:hypothetical protein